MTGLLTADRSTSADRMVSALERVLNGPAPVRVRAWDGSEAGPTDAPLFVVHTRRALRRLLWSPNQVGLARAYVAGEVDIDSDLFDVLPRLTAAAERLELDRLHLGWSDRLDLAGAAVRLGAVGPEPTPPAEEAVIGGRLHSRGRDRASIRHHYDVGNDFYRLILGEAMTYSCAYFPTEETTLVEAQAAKHDLICRKLGLEPGMRLLDVGCGWGSLVLHAAENYGVEAVGVTISAEQAALATQRIADAGLEKRVEIRLNDYREVEDGPYDAISSVGMAEHVGLEQYTTYARCLHSLLRPGGRLLNHQIARLRPRRGHGRTFIDAYVFPDGDLRPVGTTVSLLEEAGFEVRDVQALREHYGRTLRAWTANLEANWSEAVRLTSPGRARVWRLYMAGSALAFESGRLGVNQVLAVRPYRDGHSGMPPVRTW